MKYILSLLFLFLILNSFGQSPVVLENKDTLVFVPVTKDTTVSKQQTITVSHTYQITRITTVIRKYKPPIDTVIIPANKPPIANAGADKIITLPLNTVAVTGQGSTDSDGGIIAYGWTRVSGSGVIETPKNVLTNITGLTQGVHVFRLVVTDNSNATSTDDVSITVNAEPVINKPPVTDGGANVILTAPANYTILRGKATAGTGKTINVYGWSKISGPDSYSIDNPSSADCGFGSLVVGIYVFRFTATDNTGLSGTDDVTITVNPGGIVTPPPVDTTKPPTGSIKYLQLPKGTATTYNNVSNIVIEGRSFENINNAINQNGNILRFFNCSNITIRNCYFGEASGGDQGGDRAIYFNACSNITVENNLFFDQGGAVLVSSHGNGVIIRNNEFMNVRGPYPKGNFVQFNTCNGSGYVVENNRGENWFGESYPEDLISNYASSGTAASPILVQDNLFRGGGSSKTGGGTLAGDHGGSNIIIQRNKYINAGQYGISIVGGNNNKVLDNWVWQDQKPWSANGMPIWGYSPPCTNVEVRRNKIHLVCGLSPNCTPGVRNDYWFEPTPGCSGVKEAPTDFTLAQMAFPTKIITFITEDEIWQLRHYTKKHEALIIATAQAAPQNYSAQSISRPTASATFSLAQGIYTLRSTSTASAGNSISSVRWVQVSGNPVTINSQNAAVTTLSPLATGQYIFRLEVTQMNNVTLNVFTQDAAWLTINN